MIVSFFLYIFGSIVSGILLIFPDSGGLPDEVSDSIEFAFNTARSYSELVPFDTLLIILVLSMLVQAGFLLFKVLNWVVNKVRGSG